MDLYQEAQNVIDASHLEKLFNGFGKVELEGSFVYHTMVDRDIDCRIIVPKDTEIDIALRTQFGQVMLELPKLRGLQMSDPLHFPWGARHAGMKGIWYGLCLISDDTKERWNIDVWLMHDIQKSQK